EDGIRDFHVTGVQTCALPIFMAIVLLMGCSKKEYQSFEELDNANIREYIDKNNLTVHQYKETDLFYQVLEEGTGNPIDYTETYRSEERRVGQKWRSRRHMTD